MKPKIIKSWEDLAQLPDSATHRIEIGDYRAWVIKKRPLGDEENVLGKGFEYLPSNSFHVSHHKQSTQTLKNCGFNVTLTGSKS